MPPVHTLHTRENTVVVVDLVVLPVPDLGLGTLGTCPGPPQVCIKKILRLYVILSVILCKLRYNYAFSTEMNR